jgi:hypothetical protein
MENQHKIAYLDFPIFEVFLRDLGGIYDIFGLTEQWKPYQAEAEKLAKEEGVDLTSMEESDHDQWIFDNIAVFDVKKKYQDLCKHFSQMRFPLTVYRAIRVRDVDEIETTNFGECWAYQEDGALDYNSSSNDGEVFVFRGVIYNPGVVDWHTTLLNNFYTSQMGVGPLHTGDEREIRIKKGAQVTITGWKRLLEREWKEPGEGFKIVIAAELKSVTAISRISATQAAVPFVMGNRWNPEADLVYHWTNDVYTILERGHWEVGYVTLNPAYQFGTPDQFQHRICLVFDHTKLKTNKPNTPTVPWEEWEEIVEGDDIELTEFNTFLGFGVRSKKDEKYLLKCINEIWGDPRMFAVHYVPYVTPKRLKPKKASSDFDAWFAGSKCVDEQGKPLPLYRGQAKMYRGDPLHERYFTTDEEYAKTYDDGDSEPDVVMAYMKTLKPFVANHVNDVTDWEWMKLKDRLLAEGYDSITDPDHDIWVAIKSADQIRVVERPAKEASTNPFSSLPDFIGTAWRVDGGLVAGGSTAGDVIRFEIEELGNGDEYKHLTPEMWETLDGMESHDIVWVCKTREDALRYGEEPESLKSLPALKSLPRMVITATRLCTQRTSTRLLRSKVKKERPWVKYICFTSTRRWHMPNII